MPNGWAKVTKHSTDETYFVNVANLVFMHVIAEGGKFENTIIADASPEWTMRVHETPEEILKQAYGD